MPCDFEIRDDVEPRKVDEIGSVSDPPQCLPARFRDPILRKSLENYHKIVVDAGRITPVGREESVETPNIVCNMNKMCNANRRQLSLAPIYGHISKHDNPDLKSYHTIHAWRPASGYPSFSVGGSIWQSN